MIPKGNWQKNIQHFAQILIRTAMVSYFHYMINMAKIIHNNDMMAIFRPIQYLKINK